MQTFGLILLILGCSVIFLARSDKSIGQDESGKKKSSEYKPTQPIIIEGKMNSVKLLGMFIALVGFALFFGKVH